MSELTLTVLRFGLLALLWFFVFSLAAVLRGDLIATHLARRVRERGGALAQPTGGQHRGHLGPPGRHPNPLG